MVGEDEDEDMSECKGGGNVVGKHEGKGMKEGKDEENVVGEVTGIREDKGEGVRTRSAWWTRTRVRSSGRGRGHVVEDEGEGM